MGKVRLPTKKNSRISTTFCEYHGCERKKAFFMRWAEVDGTIASGIVCASHDKQLGRINLMNAYGIAHEEAVVMDTALARLAKKEDSE